MSYELLREYYVPEPLSPKPSFQNEVSLKKGLSGLIARDPWERQGLPPYCPHGSLTTKLKVRSFTLLSVYFLRSDLKVPTSPVLNPPLFSFRSSES